MSKQQTRNSFFSRLARRNVVAKAAHSAIVEQVETRTLMSFTPTPYGGGGQAVAGFNEARSSSVNIQGLAGNVTGVQVEVSGLRTNGSAFADDIDLMLISPTGQRAILLSDAGGNNSLGSTFLRFDDAALQGQADNTPIQPTNSQTATSRPSNFGANDTFAAADQNGTAIPSGASAGSALSTFTGTDPNGVWRLVIANDRNSGSNVRFDNFNLILTTNGEEFSGGSVNPPSSGAAVSSPITVTGLNGKVTSAVVTLTDLQETNLGHYEIQLQAPSGQRVTLVSDALRGTAAGSGIPNDGSGLTFSLDDRASTLLPPNAAAVSGSRYKPTNYSVNGDLSATDDFFGSGAPSNAGSSTLLNSFNSNANGTWVLYVFDDSGNNHAFDNSLGSFQLSLTASGNQNAKPVAVNDSYSVNLNGTLNVAAPGVLANDTDAENDSLTVDTVTAGTTSNGTLSLNADGSFEYVPNLGFVGTDTFTYSVRDAQGNLSASPTATVTITVNNTNVPPPVLAGVTAVNASPISATTNQSFTGTFATFTGTAGNTAASAYTATINFGDGTSAAGVVSGSNGSFTVTGTKTYTTNGSFPTTVTVTGPNGVAVSDSDTATVTNAPPPVAGPTNPTALKNSFQPVNFTIKKGVATGDRVVGTFVDGTNTNASRYLGSSIFFGDGTSTTFTAGANSSSPGRIVYNANTGRFEIRINKTYTQLGTKTIGTLLKYDNSNNQIQLYSSVSITA
jgi:hypothetical protein